MKNCGDSGLKNNESANEETESGEFGFVGGSRCGDLASAEMIDNASHQENEIAGARFCEACESVMELSAVRGVAIRVKDAKFVLGIERDGSIRCAA